MTTCTPLYRLEYAVGSDRPCDIGDTLCDFAATVESNLDRLDDIIDRAVDTIPMAVVRLTTPLLYTPGVDGGTNLAIPFDTVDVDTADMVDLAANPYVITVPFYGRYAASFQITCSGIPNTNTVFYGIYNTFSSNIGPVDNYISDGSNPSPGNGSLAFRYAPVFPYDLTDPPQVVLQATFNFTGTTVTVLDAKMSVFWLGDLP